MAKNKKNSSRERILAISKLQRDYKERSQSPDINTALQLHQAGRLEEAKNIYLEILKNDADNADALHFLGLYYHQTGDNASAIPFISRSIELKPENPSFYLNFGPLLFSEGKFDEAEACYRKAISLNSENPAAWNNLGNIYEEKEDFSKALEFYAKAISLSPSFADAYNNTGASYQKLNEIEKAISAYRKAVSLAPSFVQAHWNLANALLLNGDFSEGWLEFEWRLKKPEFKYLTSGKPLPSGNFSNATVLIISEQGIGDAIHFIRFMPLIKKLFGKTIFRCPAPLLKLAGNFPGIDLLLSSETPLHEINCDFQLPLLSIPFFLKLSSENFCPLPFPYLQAPDEAVKKWDGLINKNTFNAGLVWAGSPTHKNDRNRSIRLDELSLLFNIPGITYYSLQIGPASSQLSSYPQIKDHTGEIKDFADSAGLLSHLDMLISVDTATAHLAGATGVKTCLLLPYAPDWRWPINESQSAWYPSMKLFRQQRPKNWQVPLNNILNDLKFCISGNL